MPRVNRELLDEYIKDIDTVAVNITGKSIKKLEDLKDFYDRAIKNEEIVRNRNIEEKINRLYKKRIGDLSYDAKQ